MPLMRYLRQFLILFSLLGLATQTLAVDSENCAEKDQWVDISMDDLHHHDMLIDQDEVSNCCEAQECMQCVAGLVSTIAPGNQCFPIELRTLSQVGLHNDDLPPRLADTLFRPPIFH